MTWARFDVRRAARWSAPPAIAWLVASGLTWLVARAAHVSYWTAGGRERWDSVHYLSIARSGYEMFNCWDRPGYQEAGFRDVICGNVAWFPGYPMAVRLVATSGLSYDAAAIVVSEVAFLGMLFALWWLIGGKLSWASGITLAIGTVFAGGVYYHAAFPIALGTFALLIAVIGVKRGSWSMAAAGGFVACSCHLVGVVVVGMLALSFLFAWKNDSLRMRIAKAGGSAAIACGGVIWAKWVMWKATGHWNAYEEINRSSYGQGDLRNPVHEFDAARHFDFSGYYQPSGPQGWLVRHSLHANEVQLWANLALVVVVVLATLWRLRTQRHLEVEEWAALLLLGAVFVMPFIAGAQMSWYRNHAQMFIALVLIKPLPRALQVAILGVLAPMYVFLAAMFFAGVLV